MNKNFILPLLSVFFLMGGSYGSLSADRGVKPDLANFNLPDSLNFFFFSIDDL